MDQSIINFKVYEDSVEYVGMAQALSLIHIWVLRLSATKR